MLHSYHVTKRTVLIKTYEEQATTRTSDALSDTYMNSKLHILIYFLKYGSIGTFRFNKTLNSTKHRIHKLSTNQISFESLSLLRA